MLEAFVPDVAEQSDNLAVLVELLREEPTRVRVITSWQEFLFANSITLVSAVVGALAGAIVGAKISSKASREAFELQLSHEADVRRKQTGTLLYATILDAAETIGFLAKYMDEQLKHIPPGERAEKGWAQILRTPYVPVPPMKLPAECSALLFEAQEFETVAALDELVTVANSYYSFMQAMFDLRDEYSVETDELEGDGAIVNDVLEREVEIDPTKHRRAHRLAQTVKQGFKQMIDHQADYMAQVDVALLKYNRLVDVYGEAWALQAIGRTQREFPNGKPGSNRGAV